MQTFTRALARARPGHGGHALVGQGAAAEDTTGNPRRHAAESSGSPTTPRNSWPWLTWSGAPLGLYCNPL